LAKLHSVDRPEAGRQQAISWRAISQLKNAPATVLKTIEHWERSSGTLGVVGHYPLEVIAND
jgi:hypothetical protein